MSSVEGVLLSRQVCFTECTTFGVRRAEVCLVCVVFALAVQHKSDSTNYRRLMAINSVGLGTNILTGYFAWAVVRHRSLRT